MFAWCARNQSIFSERRVRLPLPRARAPSREWSPRTWKSSRPSIFGMCAPSSQWLLIPVRPRAKAHRLRRRALRIAAVGAPAGRDETRPIRGLKIIAPRAVAEEGRRARDVCSSLSPPGGVASRSLVPSTMSQSSQGMNPAGPRRRRRGSSSRVAAADEAVHELKREDHHRTAGGCRAQGRRGCRASPLRTAPEPGKIANPASSWKKDVVDVARRDAGGLDGALLASKREVGGRFRPSPRSDAGGIPERWKIQSSDVSITLERRSFGTGSPGTK